MMNRRGLRRPEPELLDPSHGWVSALEPGDMLSVRHDVQLMDHELMKDDCIMITDVIVRPFCAIAFVGLCKGNIIEIELLMRNVVYWFKLLAKISDACD